MEIAFSAFLSEVAYRSMSFLIKRLSKEATSSSSSSLLTDESLLRKLLRVRIIVEEAEGRQIRSYTMLEQLKVLQAGMYRGYYVLDTFMYQQEDGEDEDDHGAEGHSFALSMFNPAKRIQLRGGGKSSHGEKKLQQEIGSLEISIADATEFVIFLKGCPPSPLYQQVNSTCLLLEKCMFGRHVEMECIISFLMMPNGSPAVAEKNFDVLPIVGPAKAGKSTLVEHACDDERVRTAFSQIVFFTGDDLDAARRLPSPIIRGTDVGTVKHQRQHASLQGDGEQSLLIVEVNGDIDEVTWSTNLRSTFRRHAANGCNCKIIVCSRSDKITRFGTAGALKVGYLTPEAYWYFFKSLAFGTADPEQEPKLASMAMEIAAGLNGSFIAGNIMGGLLRANFSAKFWRMALSCTREVSKRYGFIFGAHPAGPSQNRKLVQILDGSDDYCLVFNDYQVVSGQDDEEVPEITFQEVLSGRRAELSGRFEVLAWRSTIAPWYSYVFSCEIHKAPKLDVHVQT